MERLVLYGTGKPAQLDGYSSGGKTGTAQKIDPVTHRYSKTMHIASFAGIAPVNNPAIAVAVIIDNPKGASYYGTAVSAPVFAEVAQQVLEYLRVPHDEEIRPPKAAKEMLQATREDEHDESDEDINALYAAVNDLPSDDALRSESNATPSATATGAQRSVPSPAPNSHPSNAASAQPAATSDASQNLGATEVVVKSAGQIKVPSFVGLSIRQGIETAAGAGLAVQVAGSGTIREQAPAAGSMVTPGTRVVVRGTR
jgi:cell division protein FtsI (penicillin-binding protein 3)